jgi:DNA-binding transcriptional regulator YiaG
LPGVRVTLKCLRLNEILENPETIGQHIKARRLTLKLYQRDVAQLLGICPETILHWEKGQTCPPVRAYPAMRAFLGYDQC